MAEAVLRRDAVESREVLIHIDEAARRDRRAPVTS
jgi:hypothetical protein